MKELLQKYAAYNFWANQQLLNVMLQLPAEKTTMEINSSFPSILKTVVHMLDAESGWWQRIKLAEKTIFPSEHFNGDAKAAATLLTKQSKAWEDWIEQASERQLNHAMGYQNSKREQFKQPISAVMMHVFNHSTYHRGQLVNMLRQVGVEKIPSTDFIHYMRQKK